MEHDNPCATCKRWKKDCPTFSKSYYTGLECWQPADAPEVADAPKASVKYVRVMSCVDCVHNGTDVCHTPPPCEQFSKHEQEPLQYATYVSACSECEAKDTRIEELEAEVARLKNSLAGEQMRKHHRITELQKAIDSRKQGRRDRFFAAAMQALMIAYAVDKTADRVSFDGIIEYAEKYATAAMEAATITREDTEK